MLNYAFVHYGDSIGNRHGFLLIVGYVHRGDAHAVLQFLDHGAHLHAQLRIQIGKRFIHQKHIGLDHQRARQRHALLLSAGQRIGHTIRILIDLYQLQELFRFGSDHVLGHLPVLQTEGNVLAHGHVREDRIVLEYHADVSLAGIHIVDQRIVKIKFAVFNRVESGNHAQQRGLSAAGRPQQREEFTVAYIQTQIVNYRVVTIPFYRMFDINSYAHKYSCVSVSCNLLGLYQLFLKLSIIVMLFEEQSYDWYKYQIYTLRETGKCAIIESANEENTMRQHKKIIGEIMHYE